MCTRSSRVDYRFSIKTTDISLSVASPRLEIEKLLSLVFLGLRYASDTLLWIEGKKKRGEPRERAGARVSFRVPASVSVPNPRRDFDRCRFYPEPKSLLHQISNQIWRRKRNGHRTNILLKLFIQLFVNIDYYYCFIFPILILYSQLGNFTCSWVQMFDFMENMYNIPNNHKMQQITFSKNFIIYFVFKTINRIYIHIFQLVVKIHAMEG